MEQGLPCQSHGNCIYRPNEDKAVSASNIFSGLSVKLDFYAENGMVFTQSRNSGDLLESVGRVGIIYPWP